MTRKITKWTQGHLIKSYSNKETPGMKVKVVGCNWPDMVVFAQFSFRNLLKQIKGLPLWLRGYMQETWVQSLGQEDPLEKEMATHSSTLAWRILWREEPGRLQSMGLQRVGHDWATSLSLSTHSSILAWRISWTQEPGELQSMGSQRARHNWMTNNK